MNGVHRDYSERSLEEKKELRKINDELSNRLLTASRSLESLKHIGKSNDDPEHAARLLDDVHNAVAFTDMQHVVSSEKKRSSTSAATSTVKALLNLDEHSKMVEASTKERGPKAAPFHVDPSIPLPLSFEAKRERIQKQHSNSAESSYSGLFRKNAATNPHVEQGPVPDLYTPLPTSRRVAVQQAKERELSKHVSTFTRSKEFLSRPPNPPQLHGKKVARDFVPSVATMATQGTVREEVAMRQAVSQGKVAGDRPFR